jgi:hypothetical protein
LAETGQNFSYIIENHLKPVYMKHFHKNSISGNKNKMRELWSATLDAGFVVPEELKNVKYNTDSYTISYPGSEGEVLTMYGLLKKYIPKTAEEVFAELMETEKYRKWEYRGPLIFKTLMRQKPDIIVLTEYDIHTAEANYLEKPQSFEDAMKESDYQGIFFSGVVDTEAGIGIWWKKGVFRCDAMNGIDTLTCSIDGIERKSPHYKNVDFHEQWHKKDPKKSTESIESVE